MKRPPLRLWVWSTSGGGIVAASAGLYGLWGWPAAALFVGACLMMFGLVTAVVAGGGRGRRG